MHECKKFWLKLLGNILIFDILTPVNTQLASLILETAWRLLEPAKIDFDFVEVSNRFCVNIKWKMFVRKPKWLKVFPRAYLRCTYDEDKILNPKPFIEGMDKILQKYFNFLSKMFDKFVISYQVLKSLVIFSYVF